MRLTANEIRAAYFSVATCRRALAGRTVPPSVAALADRLEVVLRTGEVSPTRQRTDCGTEQLETGTTMEWVGTRLAAEMLGWPLRRVQRHAADLDGQIVGARWVFPARAVEDYREAMKERE